MSKYIYAFLVAIIVGLVVATTSYKNAYEKALQELSHANLMIKTQNEAIRLNAIEIKKYSNSLKDINAKIENRYKTINTTNLKDCKAELSELKKIIETFYTR